MPGNTCTTYIDGCQSRILGCQWLSSDYKTIISFFGSFSYVKHYSFLRLLFTKAVNFKISNIVLSASLIILLFGSHSIRHQRCPARYSLPLSLVIVTTEYYIKWQILKNYSWFKKNRTLESLAVTIVQIIIFIIFKQNYCVGK